MAGASHGQVMGKFDVDGNARSTCAFATGRLHFLVRGRIVVEFDCVPHTNVSSVLLLHTISYTAIRSALCVLSYIDSRVPTAPSTLPHRDLWRNRSHVSLSDPDREQHRRCAQGSLWPDHHAGTPRARPHYRQACQYTRARPRAALALAKTSLPDPRLTCRLWTRLP